MKSTPLSWFKEAICDRGDVVSCCTVAAELRCRRVRVKQLNSHCICVRASMINVDVAVDKRSQHQGAGELARESSDVIDKCPAHCASENRSSCCSLGARTWNRALNNCMSLNSVTRASSNGLLQLHVGVEPVGLFQRLVVGVNTAVSTSVESSGSVVGDVLILLQW